MNQVAVLPRPAARAPETRAELETFVYDDAIVRKFLVAMYAWGIVAFLAGFSMICVTGTILLFRRRL